MNFRAIEVLKNSRELAKQMTQHGFRVVSGGTDSHMFLVDLRPKGITGKEAEHLLDEAGIAYVHLQALGTPKPGRDAVRAGHPERMEVIFREHMTSDRSQAELVQAKQLARERPACLLCFERDHTTCHRRLVAEMITAETGQPVVHLAAP